MRHCQFVVLFACASALGGCASAETQEPIGTGTPGGAPNTLTFHTGEFEAPAGDSFECFYTDTITDRELHTVSASATQGPGGHHVTVYYTDTVSEAQHHPCTNAEMLTWHQVGAAASGVSSAEGRFALPPGLAIKIPAGKQMVVQAHYINTSGAAKKVNDSITLNLIDPADVKEHANDFVMVDLDFEVPAQGKLTSQRTCTVGADLDAVVLIGHMHEAGKHFKLERADDDGQPFTTLYEHDWTEEYVSHPPVLNYTMEAPLHLAKGTKLRQTCDWNNAGSAQLTFPNEMCLSFFYYFPDRGELLCPMDPAPAAP